MVNDPMAALEVSLEGAFVTPGILTIDGPQVRKEIEKLGRRLLNNNGLLSPLAADDVGMWVLGWILVATELADEEGRAEAEEKRRGPATAITITPPHEQPFIPATPLKFHGWHAEDGRHVFQCAVQAVTFAFAVRQMTILEVGDGADYYRMSVE